eukprot:Hpha_TRINITY_DN16002_c2_g2::TRINITY_DN16002_c2_g2_i1::g.122069::m.122069
MGGMEAPRVPEQRTYATTTSWFANNTPTLVLQGPDDTPDGAKTALTRFPPPSGNWAEAQNGPYEFPSPCPMQQPETDGKHQTHNPWQGAQGQHSPMASASTGSGGLISATSQEFVPVMQRPPTPRKRQGGQPSREQELEKQVAELQAEVKALREQNKELQARVETTPREPKLHEAWERVPLAEEKLADQSAIHPYSSQGPSSFPAAPPPAPPPVPPAYSTCEWEPAQGSDTPAVADLPVITVGGIRLRPLFNPEWLSVMLPGQGQQQQAAEGQTGRRRRRHRGRRGKRGGKNGAAGATEEEDEEDEESQEGA